MRTADTSATGPFLLLDPHRHAWSRGIERLDVALPRAGRGATDALPPDEALSRLAGAGLQCERVPGEPLHILGGIARSAGKIRGFEQAFAIFEEAEGGYTAAVAESGTHREQEKRVSTLAAAVQGIIEIYRHRHLLRTTE